MSKVEANAVTTVNMPPGLGITKILAPIENAACQPSMRGWNLRQFVTTQRKGISSQEKSLRFTKSPRIF